MSARGSALWMCAVLAVLSACKSETTPTEVIVLIDADAAVAERAEQLHVQVQSRDDGKTRIDKTSKPDWPVALALAPKDGDATRTYRVSAEALDADGATVASARLISGYVAGAKLYVVLQLEAGCIDHEPACAPDQTCHDDVCIDADVDPAGFSDSRDRAPVAGDLAGGDAHADGGASDGDGGDGGMVDPDASDAGDASGPDVVMMSGDECDTPCQQHATCTTVDGEARCECKAGFVAEGEQCVDVNECKTDRGGCDSVTSCTNEVGSHTCGECPEGYRGTGHSGCEPFLRALALSYGTLDPELDPDTHDYRIVIPIGVQTLAFDPTVADGTVAEFEGAVVEAGNAWSSPELDLGTTEVQLVLKHDGRDVLYTFEIERAKTFDYLKASNTNAGDVFGGSIAISGDTLVVGAPYEDSSATGVNSSAVQGQADNDAKDSGAVYVFVHRDGRWKQQAYLKASNTDAGDWFGMSVAIDGDTIVVGAPNESSSASGVNPNPGQQDDSRASSGAAYVFVRSGDVWQQQAYLKASNPDASDTFGAYLAISRDTVAIASFESSNFDGVSTSLADQNDNSAQYAGAVYVFARDAGVWTQQAYLKASNSDAYDWFGSAVAIDADTLVVGAYGESSSDRTSSADNSASESGAAYVFVRAGVSWQQQAYLKAIDPDVGDSFGISVAIAGDTIVVGAPYDDSAATGINNSTPGATDNSDEDSGAVFVFVREDAAWREAYLKASKSSARWFGYSVAAFDDQVLVGAPADRSSAAGVYGETPIPADEGEPGSGAAYLFERHSDTWTQRAFLKATQPDQGDDLGVWVALSDDFAIVAAMGESSMATGVNNTAPGPGDNSASGAGAVFVY